MAARLQDKVAILTGAASGIGEAVARRYLDEDARCVLVDVKPADSFGDTLRAAYGERVLTVSADVTRRDDIQRIVTSTLGCFGRVDILFNNAALFDMRPLLDESWDVFDRLFAVNVKGTFLTCQLAASRLNNNGVIVNFSSSTTALALPTYSVYVATKGAVEQMSHIFAKEMGARGIRVNVVSPGPVNTSLFTTGKSDDDIKRMASLSPFNRIGEPNDIANVVAWLASDEAAWVSGQNIRANGALI